MTKLSLEDIDQIEANATNVLHIARHFSELSLVVKRELIGKEYEYYDAGRGKYVSDVITEAVLTEALQTPGSKFFAQHPDLSSPTRVIETSKRILRERIGKETVLWEEKNAYSQIELTESFVESIGTQGVVDMSELTDEEAGRTERVAREVGGPVVQVLRGATPKHTNQLAIGIYKRKDTGKVYLTAYPGFIGTPALPSNEQNETERSISEAYWSRKVFLV